MPRKSSVPYEVDEKRMQLLRAHPLAETLIGYRRSALSRATGSRGPFETWLDDIAGCVDTMQIVRQSSKNRRRYREHFETATAYREADPDVAAVRRVDIGDLLDGTVPGMPAFRIEKGHLPGGGRSQAYIGTAVVVGRTLFIFVLNSAAENNLAGSDEDNAGNAFTAAVQIAVRRLSFVRWAEDLESRLWVYFPDKSRLCRDERHAINLVDTLAWAQVVLYLADQSFPNLDDASAKLVLGVFLSMSAQELEAIVQRLFGTKFGILRAGKWLGQEAAPITHQVAVETLSDGRQTWQSEDPHQLALRDDAVEMLTGLVDTILISAGDRIEHGPAGANPSPKAIPDWKHVAKVAGTELGVESRAPTHISRGGLPVNELQRGGALSIRKYLEPRWVQGWRTGRTPFDLSIPKVIASTFQVQLTEHQEWIERSDGTVAVRTLQEMPLPELPCENPKGCERDGHVAADGTHLTHGFGIPEWKWDRVQELLERTARRGGESAPGTGRGRNALRHPFASTFEYEVEERQYKLFSSQSENHGACYQFYTRSGAPDPSRAWTKGEDEICLATVAARTFSRALGEDLERLLLGVESELLALSTARSADDEDGGDGPVERAEDALRRARERQSLAQVNLKKARRSRLTAKGELDILAEEGASDEEVEDAAAQLAEAEEMLAEAKAADRAATAEVVRREAEVATAATTESRVAAERKATVDLSQPLVVAKALQKADGCTLRVLNDAVLQMLDQETSRIEVLDEDHTQVIVRPTWRFVTADTKEVVTHQRTVRVARLAPNPKTKTKSVDLDKRDEETIPRLLFDDGLSRVEIANRFRIAFAPGDGRAYGFQIARRWLDHHDVNRKLHHALLDAPRVVRRVLYLALTGDQTELEELLAAHGISQEYADLLVARYTAPTVVTRDSWGATWVGSNHAVDRAVVAALRARDGRATIGELSAATSLTPDEVARAAHLVPPSQRHLSGPRFAQPPSVLKCEWRGQAAHQPLGDRELWLPECPHDCDGWVTHPLWTPETDPPADADHQHAGLCPSCRRTPWGPTIYPTDYLRTWAGFVGRAGGRDTRKTTVLMATAETLRAVA